MPTSTLDILNAQTNHIAQTAAAAYLSSLGMLEFIGAVISAVLIACIVIIIIKTHWLATHVERLRHVILETTLSKELAKKEWIKIEEHFFKGSENDLKIAVIEADKLLEEALREAGVRGGNLGDRLKNIKRNQLPNLDQLWQAHRLRNDIVHQPTFKLKRDTAERAIKAYEETLKGFHLID